MALWRLLRSSCSWMNHGIKKENGPKASSKPLWKRKLHVYMFFYVSTTLEKWRSTFFKVMSTLGMEKKGVSSFFWGSTKAMQHLYTTIARQAGEERLARIWMRLSSSYPSREMNSSGHLGPMSPGIGIYVHNIIHFYFIQTVQSRSLNHPPLQQLT